MLLAQGETARSVEANRKAVELKPDFAEAWSNLSGALGESGDTSGEIDAYQPSAGINPRLAPVWSNLGRWLRPSFDSFPRHSGYLKADAERASRFSTSLRHTGATAVAGISWSSANREIGADKSSALVDWVAVLRVPGVRFVDMQYGDTAGAREELRQRHGLEITHLDDVDLFNDLEGLAALCAACDLVITVSNVTAHMAGALGKPVWLLAPASQGKIWYWFSGRNDSPWYPTMRIFDQAARGSWQEVLDAVARELAVLVKSRWAVSG